MELHIKGTYLEDNFSSRGAYLYRGQLKNNGKTLEKITGTSGVEFTDNVVDCLKKRRGKITLKMTGDFKYETEQLLKNVVELYNKLQPKNR